MQIDADHPSHAPYSHPALTAFPDRLYVIAVIYNPSRYRSRYRLYRAFEKHMHDSGAILYTVECAFGGRPFEVTDATNPRHIQLRTDNELWLKENLLNIGISRLPRQAKYIAMIDADFTFVRSDWAQETIQQLQHHAVVQLFSQVTYLDPQEEHIATRPGFAASWLAGNPIPTRFGPASADFFNGAHGVVRGALRGNCHHPRSFNPEYISIPNPECSRPMHEAEAMHADEGPQNGIEPPQRPAVWGAPGGAWAWRREALDGVGGLIDCCILGSADYFMAVGLVGKMNGVIPDEYSDDLRIHLLLWEKRAAIHVRENIGFVQGMVVHHWHGKMTERYYAARETILKKRRFSPLTDLKRDTQGVYRLHDNGTHRMARLRDDIRTYFALRNEDSIDNS